MTESHGQGKGMDDLGGCGALKVWTGRGQERREHDVYLLSVLQGVWEILELAF